MGKPKPHEVPPPYRRFAGYCHVCDAGLQWEAGSRTTVVDREGDPSCEASFTGRHVLIPPNWRRARD
ncbi:hypothetical protein G6045_11510 [Streptomyces sp. YC504]|uniref:Uncharacterized protein n=1 Tax=Streptomyces mesophilus TaxID=1775132 RepID=A0A6G4XHV0_9ACTN|nr:hypothetical protein [Streptomyces mesophilus]NGO76284.1 hypothetical protein [Streptomyces mesophilus]